MSYKELGRMKDTPWHIGYVKKTENDPRRHKSRCSHYRVDGSCGYYSRCIGSAHCPEYVDVILQKEKDAYKEMRREERAQEKLKHDPKAVCINDIIEIYSKTDKSKLTLDLRRKIVDLPDLHKECIGKRVGECFTFRGDRYTIIRKCNISK